MRRSGSSLCHINRLRRSKLGIFDIFKSNKPFISVEEKSDIIVDLVISRMKKFGGIDINTKERSYFTDDEFQEMREQWDVVTIIGHT